MYGSSIVDVSKVSSNESTVKPSFRLIRANHYSLGPQTYLAWGNTTFKHEICQWQKTRFRDIIHENQTEALRESTTPLGEKATSRVKLSSGNVETKMKTLQKELPEQ